MARGAERRVWWQRVFLDSPVVQSEVQKFQSRRFLEERDFQYPGSERSCLFIMLVTDIFLLKNSATPPRLVRLRSCEAPSIRFSPTARARTNSAPYKVEKPRRAFQNYPYFGDGTRHLLAISSARDLRHIHNISNTWLIQANTENVGITYFVPNFACGK